MGHILEVWPILRVSMKAYKGNLKSEMYAV